MESAVNEKRRDYCTYFDRNYLTRGVAMIESLNKWDTQAHTIFVVCMDELTRLLLAKLQLPNVVLIPVHEIERGDELLLQCKDNRSHVEYLWTTTPSIILRLLERYSTGSSLTYLDADMFFFSDIEPLYDELDEYHVLIHKHRFPDRLKHLEENGIFNVGLLCFRKSEEAKAILRWWRERCIEWCYVKVEDGKMGDQGYLNDWPQRFPKVGVIQNIGIGTAPWNIEQYDISAGMNESPLINGTPLVVYHFHNLKLLNPMFIVLCAELAYYFPASYLRYIALPYARALLQAYVQVCEHHDDFHCGLRAGDVLKPEHTVLVHQNIASKIDEIELPQVKSSLGSEWLCYHSVQVLEVGLGGEFPLL